METPCPLALAQGLESCAPPPHATASRYLLVVTTPPRWRTKRRDSRKEGDEARRRTGRGEWSRNCRPVRRAAPAVARTSHHPSLSVRGVRPSVRQSSGRRNHGAGGKKLGARTPTARRRPPVAVSPTQCSLQHYLQISADT